MLSHLRRVDIEYHSYCNRQCEWCPNTTFKRNEEDKIMSEEIFLKVLEELRDNNFGNAINASAQTFTSPMTRIQTDSIFSFLGYQEPMSNIKLFKKRVSQAYDILPSTVQITTSTNGDFLTKESLDELFLTTLLICDYDNKGVEFWKNKLKELGVMVVTIDSNTEIITGVHRYIGTVRVECNWTKHHQLENRGGFFKQGDLPDMLWKGNMEERNFPCHELNYSLTINHDGSVMPCCHMRSDNPQHRPYILGNINYKPLTEICYTDAFTVFRDDLLDAEFTEPCKYCQKARPENFLFRF